MIVLNKQRILIMVLLVILGSWAYKALATNTNSTNTNSTDTNSKVPTPVTSNEEWRSRMRLMLNSAVDLFPLAMDETSFSLPSNQDKIKDLLQDLLTSAADLEKHSMNGQSKAGPSVDPALSYSAGALKEELEIATAIVNEGHPDRAQPFVMRSLSQCLGCHIQTHAGNQYVHNFFNRKLDTFSPRSRFFALAATRQFDAALEELEKSLPPGTSSKTSNTTTLSNDSLAAERVARIALSIAIRVKEDPRLTLKTIDKILKARELSPNFRETVGAWRRSTLAWNIEPKKTPKSDTSLFDSSKQLIAQAGKDQKKSNGGGDVDFLRATTQLHDLLRLFPKSTLQAATFLELATIYESLPGFAFWDLSERYLEACVRKTPHSDLAMTCYDRYKDSLYIGYTGSSGTNVPASVRKHLADLKLLATPDQLRNKAIGTESPSQKTSQETPQNTTEPKIEKQGE